MTQDHINQFKSLVESLKGGSPTNPDLYWIHFTPNELSRIYYKKYGFKLGPFLIRRQLRELGYKYRKQQKNLPTGEYDKDKRNLQFKVIFELVALMSLDTPIISIDAKKKERIGNLYREGQTFSTEAINVYDHDYQHLGEGKVIPHGIYDLQFNRGYISIGNSSETAEFVIDNLLWWWVNYGIHQYPNAQSLLLLCDAGGGNSYRHHIFKKQLQQLSKEIGIDIIVCHYPPYHSKWNPIEHRLFCHVHKAMSGVVFSSYEVVQKAMEKTSTTTGLSVVVRLNLKPYKTGIRATKEEVDCKRIQLHPDIPKLNYRILA